MSKTAKELAEEKETGRIEAFSDGVFGVAITLLIFTLQVPHPDPNTKKTLLIQLGEQWPGYLAYVTSFLTILIMWVNHHAMFRLIVRSDQLFMLLNGLLLLVITFVSFPTALLANYIGTDDERTAALVYSATGIFLAILYNALWLYASHDLRLVSKKADPALVHAITHQYRFGPLFYVLAFVLAFFSVIASVGLNLALAIFFAFTGTKRLELDSHHHSTALEQPHARSSDSAHHE
jgi:uncharacterized membrane protein